MDTLPRDLILLIVEQMDVRTIRMFMAANKVLYDLILSKERSIVKARLSQFEYPPKGAILSSNALHRRVCRPFTFELVKELELRQERTVKLLHDYFNSPGGLPPFSPVQQTRFRDLMMRALSQIDEIADIAADCPPIPQSSYRFIETGRWNLASNLWLNLNPFTNIQARKKQVEYIASLQLSDIAALLYAIWVFGCDYGRTKAADFASNPDFLEHCLVFEEGLLRHGSWFIGAHYDDYPSDEMVKMTYHIAEAGRVELQVWETGGKTATLGLKMTLFSRFKERVGSSNFMASLFTIVTDLAKDQNSTVALAGDQGDT